MQLPGIWKISMADRSSQGFVKFPSFGSEYMRRKLSVVARTIFPSHVSKIAEAGDGTLMKPR